MQVELGGGPYALAAGPDGALWVTLVHGGEIARVTVEGEVERSTPGCGRRSSRPGRTGRCGSRAPATTDRADHDRRRAERRSHSRTAARRSGSRRDRTGRCGSRRPDRVGRIALDGTIAEWALPPGSFPAMITRGPDDALWFTLNQAHAIGRIDTRGDLTLRDVPTRGAGPVGIAATHDALWFTELLAGRVGRIADEAPIEELALDDPESKPHAVIPAQSDGVWVSLWGADQIAHISDQGEIATLDLPPGSEPHGMAIGPDDALWVALEAGSVIRITSGRMRILVTGSSGHLGEALVPRAGRRRRRDRRARHPAVAAHDDRRLDRRSRDRAGRPATASTRSCTPPRCTSRTSARTPARSSSRPTSRGTLTLLEEAVAAGVSRVIYTSTTSAFGRALMPAPGAPANWITEDVVPVPRNIYGVTKVAAENVCELVHRDHGLPILILRTSRFFPEADDRDEVRTAFAGREPEGQRAALPPRGPRRTSSTRTGSRSTARPSSASAATSSARRRRSRPTTSPSCTPTRRPSSRRHHPGLRGRLRAPRLADVRDDRARLRQRGRPPRPRLVAALRLRLRARAARRAARNGAAR